MGLSCRVFEIYQTQENAEEFSVVGILESHVEAEKAVKLLQESGIELKKCSIVGKENISGEHVIGYYCAGDRISYWGKMGAFWGGLWGLLGGSGYFLIPGIGPVLVGGTFVSAMVGALEGAMVAGGLSILGAGLYNIGIPATSIVDYETAIKGDRFLVIVHGNSQEVAEAKMILELAAKQEKSELA
ncbi:MAG: permease [Candidatus Riflebacteria bacterium]|nr:permease [Candidatus Riflebacteria bacterium]